VNGWRESSSFEGEIDVASRSSFQDWTNASAETAETGLLIRPLKRFRQQRRTTDGTDEPAG